MPHRLLALSATFIIGTIFASFAAFAWSGPPCSNPDECNVEAPINVSDNFQRKVGSLGVGGLGVFGDSSFDNGETTYLNFGSTLGTNGYGFRDNGGTMEFKDSGDTNWTPFSDLVGGGDSSGGEGGSNIVNMLIAKGAPLSIPAGLEKWPDFITCSSGSGQQVLFPGVTNHSNNTIIYASTWGNTPQWYAFNGNGSYSSRQDVAANCGAAGSDVASICVDGRCGFF